MSSRGPGEASAGQNMQVNMKNRLARAGTIIDNGTISLFNKTFFRSDLCCCKEEVAYKFTIDLGHGSEYRVDVFWGPPEYGPAPAD